MERTELPHQLKRTKFQQIWFIALSTIALYLVLNLFTSIQDFGVILLLLCVVLIQVIQRLAQPVFDRIANTFGIIGTLLISFFGFAAVMWLAVALVFINEDINFREVLIAAWAYALVITIFQWVIIAQSDDYFLREAIKSSRNKPKLKTDVPGFIFVQLDGVSSEVLEWQIMAGNLPNIKRLIDTGGYTLRKWQTQIPSTTPASQAGLLFGSNADIPAFRWYERDSGELVVANQTEGAKLIESRLSNGKGLLADGGVSVGNLFSGDAATNIMVMSKMHGDREALKAMREYSNYFTSPYGFMRALVLSIGEMIKEVYQAQRQRVKDIRPRVHRHGSYIALRAGTNVMLRDLQTTIVLDQMMRGVNSLYVDYLDYDEIAHHAGYARPESLAALAGLDHVAGILTKATAYAPRPYHVIFVSDHGQSQGPTFKQIHDGKGLSDFIAELLGSDNVLAATQPVEQNSSANALMADGASGRSFLSLLPFMKNRNNEASDKAVQASAQPADIVVTGSGNLGNIWIKAYKHRADRARLERDYPGLIEHILKIEGIGLVMVMDSDKTPVCIGKNGEINLKTGRVTGQNPLENYQWTNVAALHKTATMKVAPDIQVISDINPASGEVYAFEELVGNHGGIGGWQTDAILLHPTELKLPNEYAKGETIADSRSVHKILTGWMKTSGQRKNMRG